MANKTIGELPAATTPLEGTEQLHLVQAGNSRRVSLDSLVYPDSVSNSKLANVSAKTFKTGPLSGGAGDPRDSTPVEAWALLGATQGLAANGWIKLPGGLILQWGQDDDTTGNDVTITWPIAFPNALFAAVVSPLASSLGASALVSAYFTSQGLSQAVIQKRYRGNDGGFTTASRTRWVAVGY